MAATLPLIVGGLSTLGGGAAAAGLSAGTISAVSGGLTVFSALGSIAKGNAKAAQLKTEAKHELFRADDERIKGMREANKLTDELFDVLGSQRTATIASGIDVSSPVAKQARADAVKKGEREVKFSQAESIKADQARRGRSRSLLSQSRAARLGGIFGAAKTVVKGFI
ncbi:MAG: hypothetical protein L3J58_11850 [Emcibacter sp.]|nr:hypothetical protein [Emcibacter sp.]